MHILATTGIRQGELLGLRRTDLLDKEHLLRIRAETSKPKQERYVPLPEVEEGGRIRLDSDLAGPLSRHLVWRQRIGVGPTDPLFVDNRGRPLTRNSVASQLKRIGQTAGVTLSSHVFRHTCAVMLLKASADLDLVYKVLGHTDLNTTKKYLRFTPKDIREEYRRARHMSAVQQTPPLTVKDVDKALRRRQMTEERMAEIMFEMEVTEGAG